MAESKKTETPEVLHHYAFDRIATIMKADEYPFLVGPAGSGKTTIGEQIAEEFGLDFYYSGAVESAFQLKGFKDAQGNINKTAFIHAYENGGVFLQDEMDASDATALVALNAAISNRILDMPDGTMLKMHPKFKLIAAANTAGRGATMKYTGRNPLDSATLDRYTQVMVDYDPDLERHIAMKLNGEDALPMLSLVHQARAAAREVHLDENFEFSTRALVKGVKFMKAGMSIEEAFMQGTMDKLDEGSINQIMGSIDKNLNDFEIEAGFDSRADFLEKVKDVSDRLKKYEEAQAELDKVLSEAEETCSRAFSLAGEVGEGIQGAEKAVEKLERVREMLKGLKKVAPAMEIAATAALESIRDGSQGPKV